MRTLLITTNKDLLKAGSSALEDLKRIASLLDQMHVFVITGEYEDFQTQRFGDRLFVYPTFSGTDIFSVRKAVSAVESQTTMSSKMISDLIIADDPFSSAATAYLLSRKYKKNFLVNIHENPSVDDESDGAFTAWVKRKVSSYVLARAHGVRAYNQIVAEGVCANIKELEKRTYVLQEPLEYSVGGEEAEVEAQESSIEALRAKYPDFNLFILAVLESKSSLVKKRLYNIIEMLRTRYARVGLIAIDNNKLYRHDKNPYVAWESGVRDLEFYYKSTHVVIDVSNDSKPGGSVTAAALLGSPVVAAESPESKYVVRPGKNGFIADPDTPADFCGYIAEIIEEPGLRETIKLFKYEMDKVVQTKPEEYEQSLLGIWKAVMETKVDFKAGKVEEYSGEISHSLTELRNKMHKVAEKVDKELVSKGGDLKKSLKPRTLGERRREVKDSVIIKENDVMDVDSILRNR